MKVAVVGAGLAGLAAACALAESGQQVTLFEARPWAGGKTYSFVDRETGESVDNGQHIFMTCCTAYIGFLRRLGTLALTRRQRRLRVPIIDRRGRRSDLSAAPLPAPLHLVPSFLRYRHLGAASKWRIGGAILALQRAAPGGLSDESFGHWLRRHGQTDLELRGFWDLILVPTLNCAADDTSAAQARFIFREGFLKSAESAAIGVPAVGLSELHVTPAVEYLLKRGGVLRTSCVVERVEVDALGVTLATANTREGFAACVLAVPPRQVLDLVPERLRDLPPFAGLSQFRFAPIVNLHCWFDSPVAPFDFAAFVGSEVQWIFNRSRIAGSAAAPEHIVISLSAAAAYMPLDRRELRQRFLPELERLLPAVRGRRLLQFLAIKEPEATFVPAPGLRRPPNCTPVSALYLAGAYTDTGWPATMESAVRSGLGAARAVLAAHAG